MYCPTACGYFEIAKVRIWKNEIISAKPGVRYFTPPGTPPLVIQSGADQDPRFISTIKLPEPYSESDLGRLIDPGSFHGNDAFYIVIDPTGINKRGENVDFITATVDFGTPARID